MSLHGFNLLQDNTRPPDTWDKVNEWVTNIGRVIVMIVEVVVIISFGARVVIDTQTKNLLEAEQSNSQSVAAFRNQELEFVDQQERFFTYKQIWNESSSYAGVIADISRLRPRSVQNLSFDMQGNLIVLKGQAAVNDVSSLENSLKTSTKFTSVQVYEVERVRSSGSSSNQANFGIRITVKPEELAARPNKFEDALATPTTTPTTTPTQTTPNTSEPTS